ncbi:MAG: hypothetical protein FWF83_08750, partial [Clostridiales bacterium]|nr:hypothetical protein [Clostridiales bacterium]
MTDMHTDIYFVLFQPNSQVFSLLPPYCALGGVFADLQEAIAFFAERKDAGEQVEQTNQPEGIGQSGQSEEWGQMERAIAVVNCLDYYRRSTFQNKEQDGPLLQLLGKLREADAALGIRLLMPESKNTDQGLLIDFMSRGFYDFWFLSAVTRGTLKEILETRREFREMEAYLHTLPPSSTTQADKGDESKLHGLLKSVPYLENSLG